MIQTQTCGWCGGDLTAGKLYRQDGSEHREVTCENCGHGGVVTVQDPYEPNQIKEFGRVFSAYKGQR